MWPTSGQRGEPGTPGGTGRRVEDREILRLAVPAFGALVAEPLFLLVDSAIVGHLGTPQLAGLGVAGALLATSVSVCVFLAYGTTAAVARRVGAGDLRAAIAQGIDGVWLALVIGVLLAAVLAAVGGPLIAAFGTAADATPYALTYLRVSLVGLPAMLVVLAATGVLRGLQDTRTPLVVATVGALANIVLNVVLVYGLDLGIAGSALGTVIAQVGMAAAFLVVVVRGARREDAPLRPDLPGIRAAGRSGLPLVVRTVTLRAALLLMTYVATVVGTVAIAAHQVAFTIWLFLSPDARRHRDRGAGHRRPLPGRGGRRGHPGVDPPDGAVGLLVRCAARRGARRAARGVRPAVHRGPRRPRPARDGAGRRGRRPAGLRRRLRAGRRAHRRRRQRATWPGPGSGRWPASCRSPLLVLAQDAGLVWLWWAFDVFLVARLVTLVVRWRGEAWLVTGAALPRRTAGS